MADPVKKQGYRTWGLVLGFGAFGGLLSAFYEGFVSAGQDPFLGSALYYPAYVCFGLGAAVVSVFWLVHVDLADAPRTAALALLAGLGWKVVLAGIPAVMEHETERFHRNAAKTAVADASSSFEASDEQDEAISAVRRALAHLQQAEDPRTAEALDSDVTDLYDVVAQRRHLGATNAQAASAEPTVADDAADAQVHPAERIVGGDAVDEERTDNQWPLSFIPPDVDDPDALFQGRIVLGRSRPAASDPREPRGDTSLRLAPGDLQTLSRSAN